jgi:saccharopine dehydrogenase (NAD+, L-lysine-forming)
MRMDDTEILVVGGYGEVGRRLAMLLEETHPHRVIVGGRHPERAPGARARRIDVDDPASVEEALDGVSAVAVCVLPRKPHLLRACIRRGLAYTSIAPLWTPRSVVQTMREEATRTGARIVLAAGIEPGISSVLARVGADRIGTVDTIQTALLLGVGDAYGSDSMAFILDEIGQPYTVTVDGWAEPIHAFERPAVIAFPAPLGPRRAYAMPFRDQVYYPLTLGAKTAIARLALDPPWLGAVVANLTKLGARAWVRRKGGRNAMRGLTERLRRRYAGRDQFALVVEVRGGGQMLRSTLVGRGQAQATAIGAAAIVEALVTREQNKPGVWLAEQVIDPRRFLERLRTHGLVPVIGTPTRYGMDPLLECAHAGG